MKGVWRFYPGADGRPGERLVDLSSRGKENPWSKNKNLSLLLAESYRRLSDTFPLLLNHSIAVGSCASWLKFSYGSCGHAEARKLVDARFCRKRLCPVCQWRRSLLASGQVSVVAHEAHVKTKCHFLMLTLTCKNVDADGLDDLLDNLVKSLRKIMNYKEIKSSVLGWFRALEVTVSRGKGFHPHFHVLLAVKSSYFKGSNYISQQKWTNYWEKALKADYKPIVHIKRVYGQVESAAAEVAKYTLKAGDYLDKNDRAFTDHNVCELHHTLSGRRLFGYGGLLKEIHNDIFKGEDLEADDADLLQVDMKVCSCDVCGSDLGVQVFNWFQGNSSYYSK
jgi:plasmid rolling circle replication initiator protein Rep